MAKPRSILDPKFKYRPSFDTDVGRHLRAHKRAEADKLREREARERQSDRGVLPLRKRSGT